MTEALDKTPAVPRPFNEGDQVYVRRGFLGSDIHRAVVTRVTKTQATVGSIRYNRQTGRLIGGSAHSSSWIEHPTPILDVQYRQQQTRELACRVERAAAAVRAGTRLDTARDLHDAYKAWADAVVAEEVRDV